MASDRAFGFGNTNIWLNKLNTTQLTWRCTFLHWFIKWNICVCMHFVEMSFLVYPGLLCKKNIVGLT